MIDWEIVAWILLGVFIFLLTIRIVIILVKRKKEQKNFDINYILTKDTLISNTSNKYRIYKSNNDLIKQYIIDHENNLVVEFNNNLEDKNLQIYIFNKKNKLIEVKFITKESNAKYSNIIKLPKNTSNINILKNSNKQTLTSTKPTQLIAFYDTITLLVGLCFVTYWLLLYYTGVRMNHYLIDQNGWIYIMGILIIVGILNYVITNYFLIKNKLKDEGESLWKIIETY